MEKMIRDFFVHVAQGDIEIYNEFSLQHELGIFLRERLESVKVQFERNVSYFGLDKKRFEKKEIDIVFFKEPKAPWGAIEVKYPRNGQVPETMFGFCKDIVFLEQLKQHGFERAYFLAVTEDKLFYQGRQDGIYRFFRGDFPELLTGRITKPTGTKKSVLNLLGSYRVNWHTVKGAMKYCLLEIS